MKTPGNCLAFASAVCFGFALLGCGSDSGDGTTTSGAGGSASGAGGTGGTTTGGATGSGGSTGGATGSGGSTGGGTMMPSDNMAASITAFLMSEGYKTTGWTPDATTPRGPVNASSPHGDVIVYMNDVASAGAPLMPAVGAMAVKELYEAGMLVGIAVMWKTEDSTMSSAWTYYCYGPEGRCYTDSADFTASAPAYAQGMNGDTSCVFCHGGQFFSAE
ncbi:MAG TPA: hypothetical protein VF989_06555 [Polyangiaceae bacterium]|jgi:hypothetical protein